MKQLDGVAHLWLQDLPDMIVEALFPAVIFTVAMLCISFILAGLFPKELKK